MKNIRLVITRFAFLLHSNLYTHELSLSLVSAMGAQIAAAGFLQAGDRPVTVNNRQVQVPMTPTRTVDLTYKHVGGALAIVSGAYVLYKKPDVFLREIVHSSFLAATAYGIHSLTKNGSDIIPTPVITATYLASPFIVHAACNKPIIMQFLWDFVYKDLLTK